MNELVEALLSFGLTRQEAIVYLFLYQNSKSTGYEIAKMTGISRSNVYNTLANLSEKGAVYTLEEGTTTKYVTVSIREFCDNHFIHLKKNMEYLKQNIPVINTKDQDGYITIQGYENILDKIRTMIKGTDKRIYFSGPADIMAAYRKEFIELYKQKKKIVLILKGNIDLETNKILNNLVNDTSEKDFIIYKKKEENAQFHLVSDSSYVLTGELVGTQVDTCLYSSQINFVNFFKEALKNEIRLIEIEKERK